jgi:hypothetical protein
MHESFYLGPSFEKDMRLRLGGQDHGEPEPQELRYNKDLMSYVVCDT